MPYIYFKLRNYVVIDWIFFWWSFFFPNSSRTFSVISLTIHFLLLPKVLQLTWKFMKENVTHKTVTINKMNQARCRNEKTMIIRFRKKRKRLINRKERYQQYTRRVHINTNFHWISSILTILFYFVFITKFIWKCISIQNFTYTL